MVGLWISSPDYLRTLISNHFINNYSTSTIFSEHSITLPTHPLHIHSSDITNLSKPFSGNEIISSIHSFKPHKAPGLDGLHPFFFQKYMSNTLPSIIKLFQEILTKGSFPPNLNKIFIALIPKVCNPKFINQFRPISLQNFY